jgi:hypothetical protein
MRKFGLPLHLHFEIPRHGVLGTDQGNNHYRTRDRFPQGHILGGEIGREYSQHTERKDTRQMMCIEISGHQGLSAQRRENGVVAAADAH